MKDGDDIRFVEIVTGLAEMYGKEISDGAMGLWFEVLKAYDISAIADAASAHISSPDSGQYMPRPADIIKMIGGNSKDSAFLAWTKVDQAVRMVGTYQSVIFDDGLIHRVIDDMGGWIALGEKLEKEWPFIANEFRERYRGYKSRAEEPDYPKQLIGTSQAENKWFDAEWYTERGLSPPAPLLIGDKKQAQAVLAGGSSKPRLEFTRADGVLALPAKEAA